MDLPIGVAAAQLVHAAGESSTGDIPEGTFAIVLGARDEDHLNRISSRLVDLDLLHVDIREPDEPWNGQLMAIGLRPIQRSVGKRTFLSSLPLYRGPDSAGGLRAQVGSKPPPAPIHGEVAQSRAPGDKLGDAGSRPAFPTIAGVAHKGERRE